MKTIQIRSLSRTTPMISMLSLASASLFALTGCPGGDDENNDEPAALVSVHGQVASSALTAEEQQSSEGLEAYLFWIGDRAVIDHAGIRGAVGASFSLSIYEEPAASSFAPEYPDLAAAQLVAMTPETAATFMAQIASEQNGEEASAFTPGTVFGYTEFWVVFARTDNAGADLLPGLHQGFNLVGPDLEARACADAKWSVYDACFGAGAPACDALVNSDTPDEAGHETCIANLCSAELADVDTCGPSVTAVPLDTEIQVNLMMVPDFSEEEVTAEEG